MREIIKLINIDFMNVKALGFTAWIIGIIFSFILSLLFSPVMTAMICLFSCAMILPLMINDDKGSNRLYGVLPVNRSKIIAAKFIYIFCVFFVSEILGIILSGISIALKLNELLPENIATNLAADNFKFSKYPMFIMGISIVYMILSVLFMYAEMIREIFGSDRLGKIITMTVLAVFGLFMCFIIAISFEIIHFQPQLPETAAGKITVVLVFNTVTVIAGFIFRAVTSLKISGREF